MFQIFKSELQRYRLWAGLATVVIVAAFGFISKLKPFLQPDMSQTAITYLAFIGVAAIFGFVQFLLHRRNNHWTYLIHRPLAPNRIFLGIAFAGMFLIAVVALLPWFIVVGGIDAFSATVVDVRHYGWAFFLMLCMITAYLVGSLAALNPSKGSVLLLIILSLLMDSDPPNDFLQYFPMLVAIGALLLLNIISFKPDLTTYVRKPWAIVLMVAPMSLALTYGLAMSTTLYYHIPKFIMGTHPDTNPVEGSVSYLWSLDAPDRVAYALDGSTHPQADHFIKQAQLADVSTIDTQAWTYPRRGQLYTKDVQYALRPAASDSIWQFSHDEMLLLGHGTNRKTPTGAIGRKGFLPSKDAATEADRFQDVPVMAGDRYLMTRDTIYQLDFTDRTIKVAYQLPPDEEFITQPQFNEDFVAIVTNKRIRLFDPRSLRDEDTLPAPDHIIDHPANVHALGFVDTYRIIDGFLLLYRSSHMVGFDQPGSVLVHARLGGETEVIHQRAYSIRRHPAWTRHYSEMVGPVITSVQYAYASLHRPEGVPDSQLESLIKGAYPTEIYGIAALLMIVSPLIAFMLCRRHQLGTAVTATWVIVCALLSLPALISFLLMNPWRKETATH